MNRCITWALVCMLSAVGLVACGGGGGGGDAEPAHTPVISNLSISPQGAALNQGGGVVAVTMSHHFSDAGSDVSTFTLRAYDSTGTLLDSTTQASSASGHSSGDLIYTGINAPTTKVETYTLEIFLTDATGAESNKLSGTFVVSGSAALTPSGAPGDKNSEMNYFELKDMRNSLAN